MQQRYYDPIAGRFLSVDPIVTDANTGKLFGRYTYVDNNPYSKIDPDGREIQIVGSQQYLKKVEANLAWLASKPAGAALVEKAKNGIDKVIKIEESKNGKNSIGAKDELAGFRGEKQDSTIKHDAENWIGPAKDTTGSQIRPPGVGLAHELDHGIALAEGADKKQKGESTGDAVKRSEDRAKQTEDKIRDEHGVPRRAD